MSSEQFSMLHPHFTPDITLGHLVQAVVVIGTHLSREETRPEIAATRTPSQDDSSS